LKDPGVDGILKWTLKEWDGGMDCVYMVQERNRWQAVVNN
jgi:hypothetical protein